MVARRSVFRDMKALRSSAVVPWVTIKPVDFEGVTYPPGTDVSPLVPRGLNLHTLIRLKAVTSDMALAERMNAKPVVIPYDAPRDVIVEKPQDVPQITRLASLEVTSAPPAAFTSPSHVATPLPPRMPRRRG